MKMKLLLNGCYADMCLMSDVLFDRHNNVMFAVSFVLEAVFIKEESNAMPPFIGI